MAWRNVELTIANIPQSMVNDFSWCDNIVMGSSKVTFNGINPVNSGLTDGFPIGDANNGLKISSLNQWKWKGEVYYNNANVYGGSFWSFPKTEEYAGTKISFIACVNDETQKGIFLILYRYRDTNDWDSSFSPYYSTGTGDDLTYRLISANEPISSFTSNGGGATHIAKVTGQLKDLSSNLSDILIVSGGGGGGMLVGETEYTGADAGGISGSGDNSADQSTGYAFGQGESADGVSGGGGGLYGGYKGYVK